MNNEDSVAVKILTGIIVFIIAVILFLGLVWLANICWSMVAVSVFGLPSLQYKEMLATIILIRTLSGKLLNIKTQK